MPRTTKGAMEDEVSQAVGRFEKESMGRGPFDARAHLVDDIVLVRLKDVLTPAERKPAADPDPHRGRGRDLIEQVRRQLIESGATLLGAATRKSRVDGPIAKGPSRFSAPCWPTASS